MCWELGTSYNTAAFYVGDGDNVELDSYEALLPGDALIRQGHASLFVGWSDAAHANACVIELASTATDMQFRARAVSALQANGTKPFRAYSLADDANEQGATPPKAQTKPTAPSYEDQDAPPLPKADVSPPPASTATDAPPPLPPPVSLPPIVGSSGYVPTFPVLPLPITITLPSAPSEPAYPPPGDYGPRTDPPAPSSTAPSTSKPLPTPSPSPSSSSTPSKSKPPAASPEGLTEPAAADSGGDEPKATDKSKQPTKSVPSSTGGCSAGAGSSPTNGAPIAALVMLGFAIRGRRRKQA
jgi:MYXO-CTERM domain-containing protein